MGSACPKLKNYKHGQWGFRVELPPDAAGPRRPRRRRGFDSASEAESQLEHVRGLLAIAGEDDAELRRDIGDVIALAFAKREKFPDIDEMRRLVRAGADVTDDPLMAEEFAGFLAAKKRKVSRNTYRSYESHVRLYLGPHLGQVRRRKLQVRHLDAMYDAIEEHNELIAVYRESGDPRKIAAVKWQRPVGPTSIHRINGTLKTCLNRPVKQGLLVVNVASLVELPAAVRWTPLVWTPERVQLWQRTGTVPCPVMVWTPEQTGRFLDVAVHHPLYPLFHLIAHIGLRRGEACGLRRSEISLATGEVRISNQIVQWGWETGESSPKTDESVNAVAIDQDTALVLAQHLAVQDADRARLGSQWKEHDLAFTQWDGSPLHPASVTDVFYDLSRQAGLPPIRLHDLRHGAATLALAAGVEMKVVQRMLRHSSITVTSDTYTTVLPQVAFAAAEATAAIIPRQSARSLGLASGSPTTTMDGPEPEENLPENQNPQVNESKDLGSEGAPSGTRTPNPLVKSQLLCQLS
ncbi:tyrosine-type recombinase/integrase [Amycolatopsis albidoflavus]